MLKRRIQPARACKRTRSQDDTPKVREKEYSELPFPNEIMLMIMQHLSLGDMGMLLRTSRALRFLALDTRLLVKTFEAATMEDFMHIGSSRLNEMIFVRVFPVIGKIGFLRFVMSTLFSPRFCSHQVFCSPLYQSRGFLMTKSLVHSCITIGNQSLDFDNILQTLAGVGQYDLVGRGQYHHDNVHFLPYFAYIYGFTELSDPPCMLKRLVCWMIHCTMRTHGDAYGWRDVWPQHEYRKLIDTALCYDSVLLGVLKHAKDAADRGFTNEQCILDYLIDTSKANVRRFPSELGACVRAHSEAVLRDLVDR